MRPARTAVAFVILFSICSLTVIGCGGGGSSNNPDDNLNTDNSGQDNSENEQQSHSITQNGITWTFSNQVTSGNLQPETIGWLGQLKS